MGGKSKPTIGYWYRYLIHFGLSQVLDALLEMRGGDRTAWSGRAEGGTISIDARELWGGEKAEGGIEGELDVMLGHGDQEPNGRLTAVLGDQQSAYRGRATVAFEGLYGAFNPYPKSPAFKGVRIFEGWEDDTVWYPEKAAITVSGSAAVAEDPLTGNGVSGGVSEGTLAEFNPFFSPTEDTPGTVLFKLMPREAHPTATYPRRAFVRDGATLLWDTGWRGMLSDQAALDALLVAAGRSDLLGPITSPDTVEVLHTFAGAVPDQIDLELFQATIFDDRPNTIDIIVDMFVPGVPSTELVAMNPAHIIYESLTHSAMQGEPLDAIDETSFTAAADLFYDESFGLCTKFNPVSESVEAFQKRILNVVAANLARSRVDGKYYLTPVRGVHDLEALPVLEDDDILEYEEEPSDPLESVNQVSVEWYDPVKKKKRTTTPIQSLGAIQSAGGIVAEVASYLELPLEFLALRVAARDLAQKSPPIKRFRLTTNRVPYAWRAGQYFRLQAPRRGVADMVCMVGEIDAGTPRSGSMRLVAIQDVSSMPITVYVDPEPGVDTSPSPVPLPSPVQKLLEAPYVELAGDLAPADLAAMADDAGYVLAVAARPESGLNYTLYTAATGESLADRGSGDWCPTALVVEAGTPDPGQTGFTLEEGFDLSLVTAGTAALWGEELVRVDAIDVSAMTMTLGRGCGDTTPQLHDAGERIWFYDTWAASDRRDYAGGEIVTAKLRTRTSSQLLDESLAPVLSIELDERAFRPYPPGALAISDDLVADVVAPASCVGELTVAWAHRDRLLQADQLVDAAAASIGPEAGTSYTVRYYLDDVLEETESGITGDSASPYTLSADGAVRIEVEAVRDGATSWQAAVAEFNYLAEPPDVRITDASDSRVTDSGDRRITE